MAAVRRVKDGDAIRKVVKEKNIDGSTLSRYVKKAAVGRLGILVTGTTALFFGEGRITVIYNIPALVAKAFPKAMMVENITSGFRVTGTFPHNADVFPEEAFLPAQVTDR